MAIVVEDGAYRVRMPLHSPEPAAATPRDGSLAA